MVETYEVNGSDDQKGSDEMGSCIPADINGEGSRDTFEDILNQDKDDRPVSDVKKRRPTGYISVDNLEAHLSLQALDQRPKSSNVSKDPVLIETKKGREESKSFVCSDKPHVELKDKNGQKYVLKGCLRPSRFDKQAQAECEAQQDSSKRVDRRGNEIKRDNRKKYKLTFVDQINKHDPLLQVNMVESYKKYNTDQSQADTPCCVLF